MEKKTRYVISALSNRAIEHFALPLLGKSTGPNFDGHSSLAGIFDLDEERVSAFNEKYGTSVPFYPDLETMLREVRPDCVLVAGPDGTHAGHIVTALRAGCDVITEKPMVTDSRQALEVLQAEHETNRRVRVAFNFRYMPMHKLIKRLIMDGRIGRVTNIDFNYNLNTFHGSSYFFRWNRQRALSGGLSLSKSVHHLDLVNWWLDDAPSQIFAYGALNYFGPGSPHRPASKDGMSMDEVKADCPYFRKWFASGDVVRDDHLTSMFGAGLPYKRQYPKPIYIYDEEIDIEDTYSAVVRYGSGASMAYSINFSSTSEGYALVINGTHGRLDAAYIPATPRNPYQVDEPESLYFTPLFGPREKIEVPPAEGGHGGADYQIQRDLFEAPAAESLELDLCADSYAGSVAVAAGEAIWRSVKENRPINLSELLPDSVATDA